MLIRRKGSGGSGGGAPLVSPDEPSAQGYLTWIDTLTGSVRFHSDDRGWITIPYVVPEFATIPECSGGVESEFYENGMLYSVHLFETAGVLNVLTGGECDCLLVGGGGGSGAAYNSSSFSGDAGEVVHRKVILSPGNCSVSIGSGGLGGSIPPSNTQKPPVSSNGLDGGESCLEVLGETLLTARGGWGSDGNVYPGDGTVEGYSGQQGLSGLGKQRGAAFFRQLDGTWNEGGLLFNVTGTEIEYGRTCRKVAEAQTSTGQGVNGDGYGCGGQGPWGSYDGNQGADGVCLLIHRKNP